jgi:hypothetical protein
VASNHSLQTTSKKTAMTLTISAATLVPVVSLAAGIAILAMPRLLNYIVAGYLIVNGVLGLVG